MFGGLHLQSMSRSIDAPKYAWRHSVIEDSYDVIKARALKPSEPETEVNDS